MWLVISGAIVFFVGFVVGFLFAAWGIKVLLERDGYILINHHIQKKRDIDEFVKSWTEYDKEYADNSQSVKAKFY